MTSKFIPLREHEVTDLKQALMEGNMLSAEQVKAIKFDNLDNSKDIARQIIDQLRGGDKFKINFESDSSCMDYLREQDPQLIDSLSLASKMGMTINDIDSRVLAELHSKVRAEYFFLKNSKKIQRKKQTIMSTYKEAVDEAGQFNYLANIASMYPATVYRIYGGYAVLNFQNIEHVKEFAETIGSIARLAYFKEERSGKWVYDGMWDGKLFTIDKWLKAHGAEYEIAKDPRTSDDVSMRIKELANGFNGDFDALTEFIDAQKEIITRIESCASSYEVVTLNGEFYDNIPKEMIGFSDDAYKYEIGVFVEPFDIYLQDAKE